MSDEVNFSFRNIKKVWLIWIAIFIFWFIGLSMLTADLRILKKEYYETVLKFIQKYEKRLLDLETSLSTLQQDLQPLQQDLQSYSHDKNTGEINLDK